MGEAKTRIGVEEQPHVPPEIFIGLVGAVGSDLAGVEKSLGTVLERFRYDHKEVRLIELLHGLDRWKSVHHTFEDVRISEHMDAGNEFRRLAGRNDALAVLAMVAIQERHRRQASNNDDPYTPLPSCAYILRSLKHPDEVRVLRCTYGQSFVLVGVYSPREARVQTLMEAIAKSRGSPHRDKYRSVAEDLNSRDEEEMGLSYGQNVRDTFSMADVFIQAESAENVGHSVDRLIELMFGYPYHTPLPDEYGMFHAQAAALRSGSLARQVGAAIANEGGEIIALGTNEVPKSGGGFYWANDEKDQRDFRLGYDTSDEMRQQTLQEVLTRLTDAGWLKKSKAEMGVQEKMTESLKLMQGSQLMRAIEYGRCVHAEMAAILDAANRGAKIDGSTMYTTTFPCHDCARHIVSSGIRRVVYIEPYAKSLAPEFHGDAIAVDEAGDDGRVSFRPFVGVGPRLYMNLFAAGERKDDIGKIIDWTPKVARLRYFTEPAVYVRNETEAAASLLERLQNRRLKFAA